MLDKEIKVGNTPLVELTKLDSKYNLKAKVFAKLESYNPAGSVKDRVALAMIEDAERQGILRNGSVIIEPTSGNTGIGLAYVGRAKGYRVILTMPESMSMERRRILASYGAELVLTSASQGMKGAIARANELKAAMSNAVILGQFDNPANPKAHYLTTGPEIYKDLNGKVDVFVAGVGTGGTITGVGKYLKEQNPDVKIIAVEPASSPVLSGGEPGPHKIQGIGAGFVPNVLDKSVIDQIITVENDDAFYYGKLIRNDEGISVGISSGAALCAAMKLALLDEYRDKNIVVLLPDGGDRYLSTPLFE